MVSPEFKYWNVRLERDRDKDVALRHALMEMDTINYTNAYRREKYAKENRKKADIPQRWGHKLAPGQYPELKKLMAKRLAEIRSGKAKTYQPLKEKPVFPLDEINRARWIFQLKKYQNDPNQQRRVKLLRRHLESLKGRPDYVRPPKPP